jgi:hypothetical protein
MRTREIDPRRWEPFFSDFTHLHHGKHVNVETLGAGVGVRSALNDHALVGVVLGESPTHEPAIEVIVGEDVHTNHCIAHASRVRIAEEENGRAIALEIESADGIVTMVRFMPPCEGFPAGYRVS